MCFLTIHEAISRTTLGAFAKILGVERWIFVDGLPQSSLDRTHVAHILPGTTFRRVGRNVVLWGGACGGEYNFCRDKESGYGIPITSDRLSKHVATWLPVANHKLCTINVAR